jgi:hypothetical protein
MEYVKCFRIEIWALGMHGKIHLTEDGNQTGVSKCDSELPN